MITDDLIKRVLARITTKATYDHFFNTINNPEWVKPLRDGGYFKDPIPAIREDGYISFPVWVESQFLVRVADRAEDQVLAIIDALPEIDNERVMDDVVNILLKVDIGKAARRTELVKKYVNSSHFLMLPATAAELIVKLADNAHVRPALAIAGEMLEVLPDPEKEEKLKSNYVMIKAYTKYRDHDYQQVVEKITPSLSKASPLQTINLYVGLLQKAIDYELTFFNEEGEEMALKEKTDDLSFIWRPKIADDSDYRDGPENTLTSALRDSVLVLIQDGNLCETEKVDKLKELAENKYQIFKRIVEYALRNHKDSQVYKELYDSLLQDKRLQSAIEMEENGTRTASFGTVTYTPTELLKGLSDDQIIEKLKTYEEEPQWSFERKSLAKELAELIKSNPKHFAPLVRDIASTKNEYLDEAVRTFEEIVDDLDEDSIITILTQLIEIYEIDDNKAKERHDYYNWSKSSALRILEKLLSQKDDKTERITGKTSDIVTRLILLLSRDSDPEENDDSNFEPVDLSINSTRGKALHAIAYLLTWMKRVKLDEVHYKPVFDELDWHLDTKNDSAPAIRSVYGWYFEALYGVNEEWAIENIDKIFSEDELGEAAFDAYVLFNRVHEEAFKILGTVFKRQLPRLAMPITDDGKRRHEGLKHLVQHLALHYWYGDMDLTDSSMMSTLLSMASAGYIKELTNFIGFRLYKSKDIEINEAQIAKLAELWSAVVELTKKDDTKVEALEEFGTWFASGKFEPKWALDQLLYVAQKTDKIHLDFAVLEYLEKLVDKYPTESIKALSAMVDSSRERWAIGSWSEHATAIIRTAYGSNDTSVKELARALANKLVAKGYPEYRTIVS